MIKIGDRVRMTEAFKKQMRGDCLPGNHAPQELPPDKDLPDDGCMKCSTDHIEEFGNCVGTVMGQMERGWKEVDVRWEPSNLRYGYDPDNLEII